MSVTPNDIAHLAALARVGVGAHQVSALVNELNAILSHMDVLRDAETDDLEPPSPATESCLRADTGAANRAPIDARQFAPLMQDGFFLVPRLGSHDDGPTRAA